eukprot:SAG31_NODE_2227_length_6148_cov_5.268309_8_plen_107_part_00
MRKTNVSLCLIFSLGRASIPSSLPLPFSLLLVLTVAVVCWHSWALVLLVLAVVRIAFRTCGPTVQLSAPTLPHFLGARQGDQLRLQHLPRTPTDDKVSLMLCRMPS